MEWFLQRGKILIEEPLVVESNTLIRDIGRVSITNSFVMEMLKGNLVGPIIVHRFLDPIGNRGSLILLSGLITTRVGRRWLLITLGFHHRMGSQYLCLGLSIMVELRGKTLSQPLDISRQLARVIT